MDDAELIEQLEALARDAGLTVRRVRGLPLADGEPAAGSAICRVRGQTWVVLSGADASARRVEVLCEALRRFAPDLLAGRWLPPAVRARLEGCDDGS